MHIESISTRTYSILSVLAVVVGTAAIATMGQGPTAIGVVLVILGLLALLFAVGVSLGDEDGGY